MNPAESLPLFFKAFGDYKNPVYIYLLALVFKVTGPGILAARLKAQFSGILTALLLGLLAHRVARDQTRHAGVVRTHLDDNGIPHAVVV